MEAIQLMRKALKQGRGFQKTLYELGEIDRDYLFYGLDNEDLLNDMDNILDILARKIKRLEYKDTSAMQENTELIEALQNALIVENSLFFALLKIQMINPEFLLDKRGNDITIWLKKIRYFLSRKKQEAKELNVQYSAIQ